jgi:rare lipoprotein A (peptidoglycan hydrolase)
VVSVLVVPILLLAAPGRAASTAASGHGPGAAGLARAGALGGASAGAGRRRHTTAVRWAVPLVLAANYIPPSATTTTTTPPPPPPRPVAATGGAPVTTVPVTVPPTTTTTAPPPPAHVETGQASWYQAPAGTCASPDIAYGTVVTVTDLSSGQSVTCTVDDHQDPSTGRVLDMAEATFAQLADPAVGVIEVRVSW